MLHIDKGLGKGKTIYGENIIEYILLQLSSSFFQAIIFTFIYE